MDTREQRHILHQVKKTTVRGEIWIIEALSEQRLAFLGSDKLAICKEFKYVKGPIPTTAVSWIACNSMWFYTLISDVIRRYDTSDFKVQQKKKWPHGYFRRMFATDDSLFGLHGPSKNARERAFLIDELHPESLEKKASFGHCDLFRSTGPHGMTVLADQVFVCHPGSNRLQVYGSLNDGATRDHIRVVTGNFQKPVEICSHDGSLFIIEIANHDYGHYELDAFDDFMKDSMYSWTERITGHRILRLTPEGTVLQIVELYPRNLDFYTYCVLQDITVCNQNGINKLYVCVWQPSENSESRLIEFRGV
jgi:hypothetical protein